MTENSLSVVPAMTWWFLGPAQRCLPVAIPACTALAFKQSPETSATAIVLHA